MKQTLRLLAFLLLSLLFARCEEDSGLSGAVSSGRLVAPAYTITTVSAKHLPGLSAFLESDAKLFLHKHDTLAGAIFDTGHIIEVTDTLNSANYSMGFSYPGAPEGSLYNLIIGKDPQGNYTAPVVMEYQCDASQLPAFLESGYNLHYFKGSIRRYRFEDFFSNTELSGKPPGDCTQFDVYGDPLPCAETEFEGSGTGTGGSAAAGENGSAPGGGTGDGNSGGSGGYGITVYHIIPSGAWYEFGPGSVCQHPGECQIVINIGGAAQQKSSCPPCTPPGEGVGVAPTYPYAVNKLHLAFDGGLTPTQLQWLSQHSNITGELNAFLIENSFSEEATTAALISIALAITDSLTNFFSGEYGTVMATYWPGPGISGYTVKYQEHVIREMLMIMETEYPPGHTFSFPELLKITLRAQKETLHLGLDVMGMSPGVGVVFDVVNAVAYSIEADWTNASLSLGAAIPVAGQWVASSRIAKKVVHLINGKKVYLKIYSLANTTVKFSNRSQLRKVLGITDPAIHAHHVIPYNSYTEELVQAAAKYSDGIPGGKSAWHINDSYNGIAMPEHLHLAGHHAYKAAIEDKMRVLYNNLENPEVEAYDALMDFCTAIKNQIHANPALTSGDFVDFINSYTLPL